MPLLILAQEDGGSSASLITNLLPLILLVAVFYFLLIRPQRQRQKRHQALVSALKVGDRVTTIGGIHGEVVDIDDKTAVITVEDGGKLRVNRGAISSKVELDS